VDLTCQKPRRPASEPGDLIHNSRRPWKILGDFIQTPEDLSCLWSMFLPWIAALAPPVGPWVVGFTL
jgi:hypothetical protein